MPNVTVCTGFSPAGYIEYGRNFLDTFDQYWPQDVNLVCYVEEIVHSNPTRMNQRHLWSCNGIKNTLDRYKLNKAAQGREPTDKWKEKDRAKSYNWRYDAYKFCRQLFIPEHAASYMPDGGILAWFDGDVVFFDKPADNLVDELLGYDDLIYLGREPKHSELGFWAVRLNQSTRQFLYLLAECYRVDTVFNMAEWHSAFVFDRVREHVGKRNLHMRSLTPGGTGHVWFQSPLGKFCDHLKGSRKARGISPERTARR